MSLAPTKYLLIRKKAFTGCETLAGLLSFCVPAGFRPAVVYFFSFRS